jgi:hypothetical protein
MKIGVIKVFSKFFVVKMNVVLKVVLLPVLQNLNKINWKLIIKKNSSLRPPPPSKKSVFVRKIEIEINAWEDSPSSPLSETL